MANVVNIKPKYLDTNKGKMYFSVIEIDEPIVLGQSVSLVDIYPLVLGRSTFGQNTSGTRTHTPWKTKNNTIELRTTSTQYVLDINTPDYIGSISYPFSNVGSGRCVAFSYDIIKGSNGNVTSVTTLSNYGTSATGYVANTANEFGWYPAMPDWKTTINITPTTDSLGRGNAIYNNSKYESTDPYSGGGVSGGGGGTGDFDNTSDTIGVPSLPSESGLNTGFFTAFVCSPAEMRNISSYLWNNAIQDILDPQTGFGDKLDALKKIVGNPYDAIMGCSLIPVSPSIGGTKEMKMYGVLETGIQLSYASSRWVEIDCGTLNINEFWGGYLDYAPYSKTTSLYLPFIGVVSIDIDLIMGKALQVIYHVDILSGICIAFIVVDGSVEFQYQGHCATTIPITNADYSGSIQAGLGLVGNIANVVTSGVGGAMTGGIAGAVTGAVGSAMSQAPSIASNVMGMKPDIKSGGGVGSSGGILSVKKPYLIIERPRQSLPENQNTFTGYPCNVTMSVGDCAGYTEFETINLDGLFLTDSEKAELESLLKGGVYL